MQHAQPNEPDDVVALPDEQVPASPPRAAAGASPPAPIAPTIAPKVVPGLLEPQMIPIGDLHHDAGNARRHPEKNLRAIREGDGLTQAAFAEKLGVSKQNLSDIENERRNVSVERAAEWAKKLGYSTAQFVRLALQAEVNAAGLDLVVEVETPKKKRRAA